MISTQRLLVSALVILVVYAAALAITMHRSLLVTPPSLSLPGGGPQPKDDADESFANPRYHNENNQHPQQQPHAFVSSKRRDDATNNMKHDKKKKNNFAFETTAAIKHDKKKKNNFAFETTAAAIVAADGDHHDAFPQKPPHHHHHQRRFHHDADANHFASKTLLSLEEERRQLRAAGTGYTLDENDNSVHAHPGGTESQANADRIRLEKLNRRGYLRHRSENLVWRVGGKGDDNNNQKKRKPGVEDYDSLPKELLATQMPTGSLDLLEKAIRKCNNDQALTDFACLIGEYDVQLIKEIGDHKQGASAECRDVYGIGLIRRLKRHRHVMCSSSSSSNEGGGEKNKDDSRKKSSSSSSSITCFSDRIQQDQNVETAVCGGRNVALSYDRMLDGDFPWLQFTSGALQAACRVNPAARHSHWNFMHCLRDWMDLGFQEVAASAPSSSSTLSCDAYQDDSKQNNNDDDNNNKKEKKEPPPPTTTFFVTRSGDYSPFALAHDWVNAVIAFAVANISRTNVRINIMDRMTTGFYSPMWSLAFSPKRPVSWFPDLRNAFSGKNRVCYPGEVFFNIPARLSPLYNNDQCGASSVLRFTSDLLISQAIGLRRRSGDGDGDGDAESSSSSSSSSFLVVEPPRSCFVATFIVRRNYQTGHSIERRIPNWRELVEAIRKDLRRIFCGGQNKNNNNLSSSSSCCVVVHAIDYASYDFDQQLNISRSTDLLIGMHGAGLIQSFFLPRHGGVFEFFCPDRPPGNNRYENLARRMGLAYSSYNIDDSRNEVKPVGPALSAIRRLARTVDSRKKEKAKREEI